MDESNELSPGLRFEKRIDSDTIEETTNFRRRIYDVNRARCHKTPQPHERIYGGIHRKKVTVYDRCDRSANVCTCAAAIES